MKRIKSNRRSIKDILIVFVLFSAGITVSMLFNDISISVISNDYNSREILLLKKKSIQYNNPVIVDFKASEDNLGIISLRFFKPSKRLSFENQDTIKYEVVDIAAGKIVYSAYFKSGLVSDMPFLPLGIPLQPESKNKLYRLVLSSQQYKSNDILTMSNSQPIISTSYKFSRQEILSVNFLYKKILNGFRNLHATLYTLSFLFPFVIFILWKIYRKPKMLFYIYIGLFIFFLVFDVFYIPDINLLLQLQLTLVWVILMQLLKVDSVMSYRLSFITFIFSFVYIVIGKENYLEFSKFHIWSFIFLLIGVFFSIFEETRNKTKKRTYIVTSNR
jgi:hypothetical protein